MSVAQAPRSTATRKPRKPDPSRVYQIFLHEASISGRRTAAGRTAAATGLSDDTVRRIVTRFEKIDDAPPEVQYQPAPGQVEYEVQQEQQARVMASKLSQGMPQTVPTAAASVESEPQDDPQNAPDDMRHPIMSNIADFERELRHLVSERGNQQPQNATQQCRNGELGKAPQNGPGMPQPTISITADYVRQRGIAQPSQCSVDIVALVAQVFRPSPILAVMLFAILIGLMYWK